MNKINEYGGVKLILGLASMVIGLPALVFALFDWYQTAQPLLGIYSRYVCIFGSLGAIIIGASLAQEGIRLRKSVAAKHFE